MDVGYSQRLQKEIIFLFPGEMAVAPGRELLRTLDGPCLTLAIPDREAHIGGMFSFLFAAPPAGDDGRQAWFVALGEMELFFQDYVKLGGRRDRSSAVIFGGADAGKGSPRRRDAAYTLELLPPICIPRTLFCAASILPGRTVHC
jgi:chemotaxis receptor (MCP) glutamine deamidase CheD